MTNFDCLLVNGDSYSAPTETFPVYADIIANKLKVPLHNLAVRGVSNDRITRSTVEQIEKLKKQNIKPFVLIGWSFVSRVEIYYHGPTHEVINRAPDSLERLITLDWVPDNEVNKELKDYLSSIDTIEKKMIDWYTQLYLLSNYFKLADIPYWFFSAADNSYFDITNYKSYQDLHIVQSVLNDQKIYKLHQFHIRTWGDTNDPQRSPKTFHLSESGHRKFSDFVLENI